MLCERNRLTVPLGGGVSRREADILSRQCTVPIRRGEWTDAGHEDRTRSLFPFYILRVQDLTHMRIVSYSAPPPEGGDAQAVTTTASAP